MISLLEDKREDNHVRSSLASSEPLGQVARVDGPMVFLQLSKLVVVTNGVSQVWKVARHFYQSYQTVDLPLDLT